MPKFNRLTEAEIDLRSFFNPESGDIMTPQASEDSFIFTLPLNAWSLLRRMTFESVTGAALANNVALSIVAANQYRYVVGVEAFATAAAAAKNLRIDLFDGANTVAINSGTQAIGVKLGTPRSFLIPPGFTLRVNQLEAFDVGETLTIAAFYVALFLSEDHPSR